MALRTAPRLAAAAREGRKDGLGVLEYYKAPPSTLRYLPGLERPDGRADRGYWSTPNHRPVLYGTYQGRSGRTEGGRSSGGGW